MNADEIRFHLRDRWRAVEEIEREELRALTLEQNWRTLNSIVRFAIETGMKGDDHGGEMEVFVRWTKIKALYETGQKSRTVSRRN
jgi:hypothetical protein